MRWTLVLVVVMAVTGCRKKPEAERQEFDKAERDLKAVQQKADLAIAHVKDDTAAIDAVNKQLADVSQQIHKAEDALDAAGNDADRQAATAKLRQLNAQRDKLTAQALAGSPPASPPAASPPMK